MSCHANRVIRNVRPLIPIDQFHQSEQFLTLFQNLTTTDASSINWLHSKYSQCIDLRFLKLNTGTKYGLCSELKKHLYCKKKSSTY
jgi:hypothetical protein